MRRARAALAACLVTAGGACASRSHPESETTQTRLEAGPHVFFAYRATDGSLVDNARLRGRFTVLLFLTTFDSASQLMARHLDTLLHTHRPRINVAAIVLESSKYSPLAQVFRDSLGLTYPVALADARTLGGASSFGHIRRVPTLVVLNPRGERVWHKEGFVPPALVERALDAMASGSAPPETP